jgi:hypothetical protein
VERHGLAFALPGHAVTRSKERDCPDPKGVAMKMPAQKKRYMRSRHKVEPALSLRVFLFLIGIALICEAIGIVVNERLEQQESGRPQ